MLSREQNFETENLVQVFVADFILLYFIFSDFASGLGLLGA